jgi:hypothetical protein
MIEAIYFSETSVDFQWNTRRYIPEDRILQISKPLMLCNYIRKVPASNLSRIALLSKAFRGFTTFLR